MHEQIRTSTGSTGDNLRRVVELLAGANINVEGIGPDFVSPHIRVAVDHDDIDAALAALTPTFPDASRREAITIPMPNKRGNVDAAIRSLEQRGFCIESLLVLATHAPDGKVRVSFGVTRCREDDWQATSEHLAGLIEEELGPSA
jgi:hypothetical protein